jgi:hypothetical protein
MSASTKPRLVLVVAVLLVLLSAGWADSLQLKNGSLIKGRYLGGTETEITFQVGSSTQRYAIADVASITFDQPVAPSVRNGAPQLESRPSEDRMAPAARDSRIGRDAPRSAFRTVPAGTSIMIRTIDAIDSDHNQVGDKFQASLEQPIVVDDVVVVPKGADVYGHLTEATEAGKIQGRSQLKLELTGIVVKGQTIPLVTGDYSVSGSSRGASSAKRIGGGAAGGALLGALIGGGKGAAIGAGVGAGAGTAVQVATKGPQVHVPSETLLQFTLQQDARIPVAD